MSATNDQSPNGLEQLRRICSGAAGYEGIGKTLAFRPVKLAAGRVVFEGTPDERVYNPIGSIHGGCLRRIGRQLGGL